VTGGLAWLTVAGSAGAVLVVVLAAFAVGTALSLLVTAGHGQPARRALLATVISPLVMTYLLVWGSGKRLTERRMVASRPGTPGTRPGPAGSSRGRRAAGSPGRRQAPGSVRLAG
jgi:hypothetical protein